MKQATSMNHGILGTWEPSWLKNYIIMEIGSRWKIILESRVSIVTKKQRIGVENCIII